MLDNIVLPRHLTDSQATDLLALHGPNELPQTTQNKIWLRILSLLKEPMLLLLVAIAGIYLVLGDLNEGLMMATSAFFVIGISFYQEHRSEKALAALRELASPRALVIRGGAEKRVPARELVPGDLIALHEGDRVPADGIIVKAMNLSIDESLLTGESVPARKNTPDQDPEEHKLTSLSENFKVSSSTLVVSGTAFVRVLKTGVHTEVGKIGQSLLELEPEELNLTKEVRKMVFIFAWLGALVSSAIILIYGLTDGRWMQAFLIGLATQMALLPEEFPVVLTIFLAMGAWRLSKGQILIRKSGSIERLGAVTILCVDKTGTLTQNQMTVAGLNNGSQTSSIDSLSGGALSEEFHGVVESGILASHRNPFDPMEKAIRRLAEEATWGTDHLHNNWDFIRDYPLSDKLLAMSCVWKEPNKNSYVIAAKGAPEAVIDLCHLDQIQTLQILAFTKEMARQGLRVLGVARSSFIQANLPSDQHDFKFEWVGLIGLEDPLRKEVPAAVQLCRNAGVSVIMMTGDYPETALKIGERAGITSVNSLITGTELNSLSDQELTLRLKTARIFARMIPEQKLRIVKLLKQLGHVVAMTGDGVNDAPSLKWADVGIAMGARGTDVAREASDIVLLDDNFKSIVSGIERGRLIYSNIKKAMSYIVSIHIPIAGLSILPAIMGWPMILLPVHIVFLELIIDPACSILFESQPGDEDMMNSPPRRLGARLFTGRDLLRSSLQGFFILAIVALVFWYDNQINGDNPERARTLTFVVLILCNLGLIFADMTGGNFQQMKIFLKTKANRLVILSFAVTVLLLTQVEVIRSLFHFGALSPYELILSTGIGLLTFTLISFWNRLTKSRSLS